MLGRFGVAAGAVVVVGVIAWSVLAAVQHRAAHTSQGDVPEQVTLPFSGLNEPRKVAVDSRGNVYVTDENRVLKLAPGAAESTVLPFAGIRSPTAGIAVDQHENVYVAEWNKGGRVLELVAGATSPSELPFGQLEGPVGVAVDPSGNVYVADFVGGDGGRVLKLAPGAAAPTELPFTETAAGLELHQPWGIAADTAGSVYVITAWGRVLKLAPGATGATVLPFSGLDHPDGIAVDTAGNVYVANISDVQKLAPGAKESTTLAFVGIYPNDVAVDTAGNVYIVNGVMPSGQILSLPPQ